MYKTSEFAEYAKKNLVLVKVDFPKPDNQPETVKKQNGELMKQFNVEGYPTTLLVDANGKEIWRDVGYDGKGPKSFIGKIEKAKK